MWPWRCWSRPGVRAPLLPASSTGQAHRVRRELGESSGSCGPGSLPSSPRKWRSESSFPHSRHSRHSPACPQLSRHLGGGRGQAKAPVGTGKDADGWHALPPFPLPFPVLRMHARPGSLPLLPEDGVGLGELKSAVWPLVLIPSLFPNGPKNPEPREAVRSGVSYRALVPAPLSKTRTLAQTPPHESPRDGAQPFLPSLVPSQCGPSCTSPWARQGQRLFPELPSESVLPDRPPVLSPKARR